MPDPCAPAAGERLIEHRKAGVGYLFGAYFLYALADAAAKWLVGTVSVWEVLFIRSLLGLALCVVVAPRAVWTALAQMPRKRALAGMNLANFGGWAAYYSAAVDLPLPQLYTVYYLSPILAALLAGPMLGERIRATSWIAAALGFAGVLVTTAPTQVPLPALLPALTGVGAAALWALSAILYRRNVHGNSNIELVVYNNVSIGVCSALPLAWHWRMPAAGQGLVFLVVTAAGLLAHLLYISGVRRVAVAVAGPIAFFSLIWSGLLGYLIWGDIPRPSLWEGGGLILAAGLLVFGSQWRRDRAAA